MAKQHEHIGINCPKPPPKTPFCHHMQFIFDPQRAKTAKTRFFPELLLSYFINRTQNTV